MENQKWYSGKYDRAFKEVMLKENNRDILKMLLEKILDITINEIEIINSEELVNNVHIKGKRLDLNLTTNVGKINVEVNSTNSNYVHNKNFSYLCNAYSNEILVGENYKNRTKYIQINLSYGLSKNKLGISIYKMLNEKGESYVDNFIIYDVNMEYYMNLWYTKDTKKVKDNILIVMLGLERVDLLELSKKDKVVSRYMEELDRVNKDPRFMEYISYEEEQRFITNTLVEEALEQGISQGEKNIIKKFLDSNISVEEISKITDIPEEEILAIKES